MIGSFALIVGAALTALATIWIKDDRRFLLIGLAVCATISLAKCLWWINEYMKGHFESMEMYNKQA